MAGCTSCAFTLSIALSVDVLSIAGVSPAVGAVRYAWRVPSHYWSWQQTTDQHADVHRQQEVGKHHSGLGQAPAPG